MTLRLEDIRWDGLFPAADRSADIAGFANLHAGEAVLVTGAGGSIGAALSRAIHQLEPHILVLLDSSEQNLYNIHRDLISLAGDATIVPVLGSVADERCVRDIFERFQPRILYHAAALKHVPLGEMNPFAVVENNIFGTATVARLAAEHKAERLIMISTDKSVNPSSIMGASKRLAEVMLLGRDGDSPRMTSIRLGNVLGSEGSVVPLFLEQIARGGPVTVADPEVERYFLTMDDTVGRILRALATIPDEPTVAVPVMGKPVKIADLARFLIQQASATGVPVAFTGLRPGDKLREEFISDSEFALPDAGDGLQWVRSAGVSPDAVAAGLAEFSAAMNERSLAQLLATLTRLVPEYQPSAFLRAQAETAAKR
jgi:FlaA1/EpsC-like NDP-sugar epimerase